jgi:hypothetical protein
MPAPAPGCPDLDAHVVHAQLEHIEVVGLGKAQAQGFAVVGGEQGGDVLTVV